MSATHEHTEPLSAEPEQEPSASLTAALPSFGRLLRTAEFDVTAGRLIDAARALSFVDVAEKEQVRAAMRACFVSGPRRNQAFDELFDLFWSGRGLPAPEVAQQETGDRRPSRSNRGDDSGASRTVAARSANADNPQATAAAADLLTVKDFKDYTAADAQRAREVIRTLVPKLASAPSRRMQPSTNHGQVDLRRTLRQTGRSGGDIAVLPRREPKRHRLRLVVLCDVSGSMDVYSRYLVQFLHAMQQEVNGVHTFVFSTRLHDITRTLESKSYDQALIQLRSQVDTWSGGTSIGGSLQRFERDYARRRVNGRSVILVISDGWERGDVMALQKALARLKRRAYRLIWLNPLLGGKDYRPVAKGMAAALPYIDHFLPAHNLDSLARAARTLVSLSRGG